MVATQKYPHAAYTGLTKSLQHQWTHLQRVVPGIDPLFDPVETALMEEFLPAIYGEQVTETVRSLAALPVKCAGLAITNPVKTSPENYKASTLVCSHLSQAIQGKAEYCEHLHSSTARASSVASSARRKDAAEDSLTAILKSLPLTDGKPRAKRIVARGRETGAYLSAIPSNINGSTLGELEFQDSIRMRAALSPLNLPAQCDGCGADFSLAHSQSCKNGGNIIARHDEIISEIISLGTMALRASAVRAKPLILVRSPWALWTKHVRPVACIGGVNGNGMEQNELAPVGLSIFATQNYNLVTKEVLQDSCFLCTKLDLLDSIQIWLPGSKNVLILLLHPKLIKSHGWEDVGDFEQF